MNEVSKQLKKGIIEILILKLLSEEKMYGYQLIQELDSRSGGVFKMKEGTLYPVLYRLEDGGLIESCWEQEAEKRSVPRKYYRITGDGRQGLKNMKQELDTLITAVKSVLKERNDGEGVNPPTPNHGGNEVSRQSRDQRGCRPLDPCE